MDKEFLALSVVFVLIGVTGILLFSSIMPPYYSFSPVMTPAGDGCYCLISSPEPSAAQSTSSILLALGVMFFPMGLMKGGLPSFRKAPAAGPVKLPTGQVLSPLSIGSGGLLAFGIAVLLIGVDAVLVPGIVVFQNPYLALAGGMLTAAGAISIVWGIRKKSS
ncbi:MAG: hypothetical protein JRM73_03295 [Nitrososphaerota archaeon]|nr:hypothetical protein [Nitrososphaerota archaeon]